VGIEVFVDTFAGLSTPRIWVGFVARDASMLEKLAQMGRKAGMRGAVVRRSAKDVTKTPPYYFNPALTSDAFDVLVLETFGAENYLGTYFPHAWPLSHNNFQAIARDGVNLIGSIRQAALESDVLPRRKLAGWVKPDPLVEQAAVRHVTTSLRGNGFIVRSREHEICGYDLHATKPGRELHIEVKGASGEAAQFFISRTEFGAAMADPLWRLAIVVFAKTKPRLLPYLKGEELRKRFDLTATQWHACMRHSPTE
jgi:hypothetical protein